MIETLYGFFSWISFFADRMENGSAKSTVDLTVHELDEIVLRDFDPSDSIQRIIEHENVRMLGI